MVSGLTGLPRRARRPVVVALFSLLAAVPAVPGRASAPPAASPLPPAPLGSSGGGWRLTFQDEFEGTQLDQAKWSNGWGWPGDAAFEAGHCDLANNVVANGVLVQRAQNLPQGGMPFSAACINTRNKFSQLYGYWEARMQIPSGQRLHSAFWAKPNSGWWPPELDVEETRVPEKVTMTVHWEEAGVHVKHNDKFSVGPGLFTGFHVFGAEWTPTETIWFIDGVERFRTSDGAVQMGERGPFYMILDLQVSLVPPRPGDPPTTWPSSQYVDYVRVWSRP
jgi:beta-glucanase (GH16 family)